MSVQNIVDCTGQITGGHKNDTKFVAESFFYPINELYTEKKLVDLRMFDRSSVFRKAQKILKVVYHMMSFIVGADHTFRNVFKGWSYIVEIIQLCKEDKVCWISVKT